MTRNEFLIQATLAALRGANTSYTQGEVAVANARQSAVFLEKYEGPGVWEQKSISPRVPGDPYS